MEKREPSYTVGGNAVSYITKCVAKSLIKQYIAPYETSDDISVTLDMGRRDKVGMFFLDQEPSKTGGPENFGNCFIA